MGWWIMKFDSFHPGINLIFFVTVLMCSCMFTHPVYVGISFAGAVLCSLVMRGKRAALRDVIIVAGAAVYTLGYIYFHNFGVTVIAHTMKGNQITLEAIIYGSVVGIKLAAFIMWSTCLVYVMTTDKIVYLAGKLSPKLSLYLAMIFRIGPRCSHQSVKISESGRGIGKKQFMFFRKCSMMISWFIETMSQMGCSMKCRGYTLSGRTAFSKYRFDNRDRILVICMFAGITAVCMAAILGQTGMIYNPEIIYRKQTNISYIFYVFYGMFCMIPVENSIAFIWRKNE